MNTHEQLVTIGIIYVVDVCRTLDSEEIYDFLEDVVPDNIRDEVYKYAEPGCNEPYRNAINKLGALYNVQSMIDF